MVKKEDSKGGILSLMHQLSYMVYNWQLLWELSTPKQGSEVNMWSIEQENPVLGSLSLAFLFQYHAMSQRLKNLHLYSYTYFSFVW